MDKLKLYFFITLIEYKNGQVWEAIYLKKIHHEKLS